MKLVIPILGLELHERLAGKDHGLKPFEKFTPPTQNTDKRLGEGAIATPENAATCEPRRRSSSAAPRLQQPQPRWKTTVFLR